MTQPKPDSDATQPLLSAQPFKPDPHPVKSELRTIFKLALPCVVVLCSSQTMVVTDQFFVGHLGVTYFAAAALGNTFFNILWFLLLGISTAFDTLGSQAYGANDYKSLLTWAYTSMLVLTFFGFVMSALLWFGGEVATYVLLQTPEVAEAMAGFCRCLIPGVWPMIGSIVLMKYMQTQNCMTPPAVVAIITCLINILNNYLLVRYMDFLGAPLATSLSRYIQFAMYLVVAGVLQHRANGAAGWAGWLRTSRSCLRHACSLHVLTVFTKLGLPGGLMLALEAGAFEITTMFAGALGTVPTAAHAALLSITTYSFISFPFAVAMAATIRVGNLLGANMPDQAALASKLCVGSGTLFQATCGVIMFLFRDKLGYIFTDSEEVVSLTASIAVYGVAFQFFDGAFGTGQGVLRGMGRQHQLLLINLVGFWGCGVVLGWYLAFRTPLQLTGLWVGIDVGDFVSMVVLMVTWCMVDWRQECRRAMESISITHEGGAAPEARLSFSTPQLEDLIDEEGAPSVPAAPAAPQASGTEDGPALADPSCSCYFLVPPPTLEAELHAAVVGLRSEEEEGRTFYSPRAYATAHGSFTHDPRFRG